MQPCGGTGLSGTGPKAGGPHYPHRFGTEQTVTINTAAVGGNASCARWPGIEENGKLLSRRAAKRAVHADSITTKSVQADIMTLSVFDIFKIGNGPSYRTPWADARRARVPRAQSEGRRAARPDHADRASDCTAACADRPWHGTDRAILLGLEGAEPETVDPDSFELPPSPASARPAASICSASTTLRSTNRCSCFHALEQLPVHTNGMRFSALGAGGKVLREENYYSIGGGFITKEGETEATSTVRALPPYPFESGGSTARARP